MYLSELIPDVALVFEAARNNPKTHAKKKPDINAATHAVLKAVEETCVAQAAEMVRETLSDMYDMYEINNGERDEKPEGQERDDWDSGLDDQVEVVFTPYAEVLSNDWMAQHTIDTRLYDPNFGVDALALSFGKEIYKQLCWQTGEGPTAGKLKSPAQILANAGITAEDIATQFADRLAGAPSSELPPSLVAAEFDAEIDDVLRKVFERVGVDHVVDDIRAEFDLSLDDDEILANGAGGRLGLTPDDVGVLQMFAIENGTSEAVGYFMGVLADLASQPPAANAKPKRAPKAEAVSGDALPAEVIATISAHGGTPAATLAAGIGVSRATYNNYVNGKTSFVPNDDQRAYLRGRIVEDVNALLVALAAVDNVNEAMAVS